MKLGADMRGRNRKFGFGDKTGVERAGWVGLGVGGLWEVEGRSRGGHLKTLLG